MMAKIGLLIFMFMVLGVIFICVFESYETKKKMDSALWIDRKRVWFGLPCTFTYYYFDKERLFINKGFLNKYSDEVRLYRILDLSTRRSLLQRIFGLGSIIVKSSDKSVGNFVIKNIKNVDETKEKLSQLVEGSRKENRVLSREFMSGADEDIDE